MPETTGNQQECIGEHRCFYHLIEYLWLQYKPTCDFHPMKLVDYFASDTVEAEMFCDGIYHKVKIHPELSDLSYLRSFKFEDLTFRGTVEFRSVCEQPVYEIMACGAFHAGLMENLYALADCLENDHVIYHKGYNASELRRQFVMSEIPDIYDRE